MTTPAFGTNPSTRHFGLSSAFAALVQDTLPQWAVGIPVRTLSHLDAGRDAVPRRPGTPAIGDVDNHLVVWVSQISNAQVPSLGLPDALSSVEWEIRFNFNDVDPSALEQIQQYITSNVYNKWYKPEGMETVIRGAMLRETRLDQRVDAGYRWSGRARYRSDVYGALAAGLFENDPDSQEPHSVPLTIQS